EDYVERARLESNLMAIYVDLGEYERARPHAEEAVRRCAAAGLEQARLECFNNLVHWSLHLGELTYAAGYCERGIALSERMLQPGRAEHFRGLLETIRDLQRGA